MQTASVLKTLCQKPHSLIKLGISQSAREMFIGSSLYPCIFKKKTKIQTLSKTNFLNRVLGKAVVAVVNHHYRDYPPEYQSTRTDDWSESGKWQNQKLSSLRFHLAAFQPATQSLVCHYVYTLYHIHECIN